MKLEIITIEDKQVTFDVSMLMKEDAVMINATEVAKHFGKTPKDWLRTDEAQKYIDEFSRWANMPNEKLVFIRQGGKNQGTWIHSELAIPFARWLDVRFAIMCDQAIKRLIRGEQQRKEERLKAKTGYAPLTLAIQSSHTEPKFYHFINEANLINRIVLGLDAKDFKNQNGIESKDATRDHMTVEQLHYVEELQKFDTILLEMEHEYNDRKDLLMAYYVKLIGKKGKLQQIQQKQIKVA